MKWAGVVLALLAAWFLRIVWEDPVEGQYIRPIAVLGIAVGAVLFAEGLKREIIAGVRSALEEAGNAPKNAA